MSESRWIALHCGEETTALIERHPNAFLLLTQIAMRAKWKDCPITNLKTGQAFIGDWKEAGLHSEKAYRHAKKILTDCKLAAFRGANKGTVATLENSMVFSVSAVERGGQTGGQGADEGRSRGDQGATNHTDTQNTLTHRAPLSCPEPDPDSSGNQLDNQPFALTGASSESSPKQTKTVSLDAEKIYGAYPRKIGKHGALKAITRAIANHSAEFLLERTQAYAKAIVWQDRQFVPHPATWFNGERFLDDPSEWEAPKQFGSKIAPMSLEDAAKLLGGRAAGLTGHRGDKQAREYPEPPHPPLPRA